MLNVPGRIFPSRLLHPDVPCPACGTPVQGYVSGREVAASPTGISRREAYGDRPAAGLSNQMVYTLHPCYCEVDQYWMSAFVAEMAWRERGGVAQPVEGVWRARRGERVAELESELRALLSRRDAAMMASAFNRKAAIERDVCLKMTELARLTPDAPARLPAINMEAEVRQWARQQRLTMPRGAEAAADDEKPRVSFKQLHEALCTDPGFRHLTTAEALDMARAVHKELENYVNHGVPVSQTTLRVAVRLVPGADSFLKASEVAGPTLDVNPQSEFVDSLAFRRKRRLDVKRRKPPTDTPE